MNEIREFTDKSEAVEYIKNMTDSERQLLKPQIRNEFTYKPYPHHRIILMAFNSHRLHIDGKFTK